MWFATQDGLNRYEGTSFVRYISASPDRKYGILESDVYDLSFDEDGNYLWCLTAYGGLSQIETKTGTVIARFPLPLDPQTGKKLWFRCMYLKSGAIYIGTNEGFVIRFNLTDNKSELITRVAEKSIDKIYLDDYSRIWLMIEKTGLRVMNTDFKTAWANIPATGQSIEKPLPYRFTDFCRINDDLLICTSSGFLIVNIKNVVLVQNKAAYNIPLPVYKSSLHAISVSIQKILISSDVGLFSIDRYTDKVSQIVFSKNLDDKKWLTLTYSIFQSGENIWIGSQYGVGWIKNTNTVFTGFFESMNGNGVRIEHSTTLFTINDSTLGVCADDGLYFSNHVSGASKKYPVDDFYYHAFKLSDDHIIASGAATGLQVCDNTGQRLQLKNVFPELLPLESDLLISSVLLDDSICFMASQRENGIYVWNYKTKQIRILNTISNPTALKSNIINRLFLDSKKRLWIIGDNTVSIYTHNKNQIEHLQLNNPRNNQPLSINMDICEAGGKFWIATYGTGIAELSTSGKINRIYSAKDGINNLGLYKIFRINDSLIIASSNNGLSTLNLNIGTVINYFEEDGLQSNNFEETSGCENSQYIFLGGMKGFTKIDKKRIGVKKDFSTLYFSSIQIHRPGSIKDTSNLFLRQIEIPSNTAQVIINIASLNYTIPEKTIFRYRLRESSEDWNSLGTKRFISLITTPPGTYVLQVQASNENGEWSDPIELTLVFQPKWFQTWQFKLLVALLFLASVYSLYRFRLRQLKKEQTIRTKLASDLHDDLGSTLNSVKVYTNLALMENDKDKYINKIKESAQEAITGVKDMIWVLDDRKDTVEDLFSRVSQFASPLCEVHAIAYNYEIDDNARHHKLSGAEKRNLYMILKESVNNTCKYSQATTIKIHFSANRKKPDLTIKDNGKGFDQGVITEGNGLKNMKLRARQINFMIEMQSTQSGTEIHLQKI